jgi:hypothetical protein
VGVAAALGLLPLLFGVCPALTKTVSYLPTVPYLTTDRNYQLIILIQLQGQRLYIASLPANS